MICDFEFAILELSATEANRFDKDPAYRTFVLNEARRFSDRCDERTVIVMDRDGNELATSNDE